MRFMRICTIYSVSTLDLFDIHYEDEDVEEDSAQNKQNDTKESQKEEKKEEN